MRYERDVLLLLLLPLICLVNGGCKKSAFLDAIPDQSQVVPSSIADCQALMDNDEVMNGFGSSGYPSLGEIGSDDYYASKAQYNLYAPTDQNAAIWATTIYSGTGDAVDWDLPYRVVFYANEVMQELGTLAQTPAAGWNNAEGSAFFYRAFAFYQLAQIFAPVYDSSSAGTDWGIPLRLSADVSEKITRATVQQTYDRITGDLTAALPLLPDLPASYPTRPSRAASYGLLARVYLSANDYPKALAYSDSCLQIQHALMNYDTVMPAGLFPFYRWNSEVIFSAEYYSAGPSANALSYPDSTLFASYQPGDLRKGLFFKYGYFLGRYDQDGYCFCGLATDEMYLIRAECYARTGNVTAAMNDLNTLLQARWAGGSFTALTATDGQDALRQILMERRKELLFRGLRWTDLRRLNKDPGTAVTLYRTVNGNVYTLPPNDKRYVYPIPDNVISFNPEMPQNPR